MIWGLYFGSGVFVFFLFRVFFIFVFVRKSVFCLVFFLLIFGKWRCFDVGGMS